MGQGGSKISSKDKAVYDLKVQRDKLQQYQRRIQVEAKREVEIAKECLQAGEVGRAKLALRRKKYQESLLANTDQHLEQLQKLVGDVEFAAIQKSVLHGIQEGTKVLKMLHKEMGGLEGVERLLGESQEAHAYAEEISNLLQGKLSNQEEDAVKDELERLAKEELERLAKEAESNQAKLSSDGQTNLLDKLPIVPDTDLPEPIAHNGAPVLERRGVEQEAQLIPA